MTFERVTLAPDVLTGKPVIKGTRLSVDFIIGLLVQGAMVVLNIRRDWAGHFTVVEEQRIRMRVLPQSADRS